MSIKSTCDWKIPEWSINGHKIFENENIWLSHETYWDWKIYGWAIIGIIDVKIENWYWWTLN